MASLLPKISRVVLSLAICASLSGSPALATTIVVVRSPDEIVIAADSKLTDTYGNELNNRVCKIQQAGNLFLAHEGFLKNRQSGFDVVALSQHALMLRPGSTARERVEILTGIVTSRLFSELANLKKNFPDDFRQKFEARTFLSIVVAAFENNRPLVFVRQFRTAQPRSGVIGVTVLQNDCLEDCSGGIATRLLGETDAIRDLPEETKDFWSGGLVAGARSMVELQIAARSEYVGAPVDLLQLTARGAKWIQKKASCPNLRLYRRTGARRR